MNKLLTELGVPEELQALFNSTDCLFDFGDTTEHFGHGFHKVPTTQNLWHAGNDPAKEIIITHSAMEAIAYLSVNRHKHDCLELLACVAIGNYPHESQAEHIRKIFKHRKVTLAFGNGLLAALADVKVAAALRGLKTRMRWHDGIVLVEARNKKVEFEQHGLSLSAFEKAFGIRSGIRTRKPQIHLTFLDELYAHAKQ